MIRRFLMLLTFVGLVLPSMASALGLGEATVKSSLNQPLVADIQLTDVRNLGINEILPGLASREDFLKAGVDRVYFLSNLQFKVIKKTDGKFYIHVTSQKVVREPFLDFLIEVIWPSGRLLREYALLIDPPTFNQEKPAPITAASTGVKSTPATSNTTQTKQPTVSAGNNEIVSRNSGDTYGPTSASDTLWGLALKLRPNKSVTPQQTMLAIQDLNPDAFIDGNINKLKEGWVLRKPTLEEIQSRTRRQAIAQVNAQNRKLHNKPLTQKVVEATNPSKSETTSLNNASPKQGAELKLVVADSHAKNPEAKGSHAGSNKNAAQASKSSIDNQLSLVSEQLDKTKLENQDLSGQVKDLKEQLSTLQRLLALKNDQLASLQAAGQKSKVPSDVQSESPETKQIVNSSQATTKSEKTTLSKNTPSLGSTSNQSPSATMKVPSADNVPKQEIQTNKENVKPALKPKVIVESPNITTKPEPANQDLQTILTRVMSNPVYMAIAAGTLIVLLLLLLLLSKRSAQKEKDYLSQLAQPENDSENAIDLGLDEAINLSEEDPELNLNDEKMSDNSDTDDVISEAEVYIAYQRLDQASHILEDGISSEPGRTDIRLKLLEVYKLAGDVDGFEKQYNELAHMDDDYALDQAKLLRDEMGSLGSDITIDDLESQLLSSGENNVTHSVEDENENSTEGAQRQDDFNLDLSDSGEIDLKNDGLDVDFDISDLDLDEDNASKMDESRIDFDLNELDENTSIENPDLEIDLLNEKNASENDLTNIDLTSMELSDLDENAIDESLNETAHRQYDQSEDDGLSLDDLELDNLDLEEIKPATPEDPNLNIEESQSIKLDSETEDNVNQDFLDIDELDLDLDEEMASVLENAESFDDDLADAEAIIESLDEHGTDDLKDISSNVVPEVDLTQDNDSELVGLVNQETNSEATEETESNLTNDFDDSLLDEALEVTSDDQFIESSVSEGEVDGGIVELDESTNTPEEEEFDFLNDTDEAATKLDLARAYVDMGDAEGARDILEEVALEGNEKQKQDALALLKTLG